jgi:signal transduction histidine kinase
MAHIGHPCQPTSEHVASQSFVQLVTLACHDLRTPLATAAGFAHTLERLDEIGQPAGRYVEMIGAATDQLADLLDELSVLARLESGRYEPQLRAISARALADDAARRLDHDRISVDGDGAEVRADQEWAARSVSAVAEAARRHGGLEQISIRVHGTVISIVPVLPEAASIATGDELKDFGAAVGARVLAAAGAGVEIAGEAVHIRFPQA